MTRGRRSHAALLADLAAARWTRFRRELSRPWREGREGAAAEVGRWIGVGLAAGAFVAGLGAALYAERRRPR